MKKFLLNFVFRHYRTDIEDRFIDDVFGEVPKELTENSLKFLLSGGTSFDRWMRVSSYALQRKLKQPNKEVGQVATAGLIFFKTLDVMMSRLQAGQKLAPIEESMVEPKQNVEDDLRGVDEFFKRSSNIDK